MTRRVWCVYLAVVIIHVILTFLVPVDAKMLARYEVTATQFNLLRLGLFIPIAAIYFAAFYGYDRFDRYARSISSSPDGKAFRYIAGGLGVLAISLPLGGIISTFLNYITSNSDEALPAVTIATNYFAILYLTAAFWLIFMGSKKLAETAAPKHSVGQQSNIVLIAGGLLAILYTYFVFHNPNRQIPSGDVDQAAYYLPDVMILFTIIIPYAFMWFIGLDAVSLLSKYSASVKGILYKQMLKYLTRGIAAIVIITIVLQFLENLAALYSSLSLGPLLLVVLLLLAGIGVGFFYVSVGAKKLQKIEEV